MSREIKFRAWDTIHNKMSNNFTLLDCINQNQAFALPENFEFMQYTCLKDKNGVDIYEGDIVTHPYINTLCIVEWNNKSATFHAGGTLLTNSDKEREVVGNVYENPKLLEVYL